MADGTGRARSSLVAVLALVLVVSTITAGVAVLATPTRSVHAPDAADWPTDRGDAARTGSTAGHGPAGPYAATNWTKQWDYEGRPNGAVVANGTVFVPIENWDEYYYEQTGAVYAFDATTGAERWNRSDLAAVEESPAVHNGTVFVAVTLTPPEDDEMAPEPDSGKGGLFALDADTGETIWKTNHTTDWEGGGSTTVVNGTVYAATDYRVYAFDAATGEQRWRWNASDSGRNVGYAVADGSVYVTHTDGNVTAIDAATGEARWTTAVPSADGSLSSPAVADGAIYVSSGPVDYNPRVDYGDDVRSRVHRLSTDGSVEWTVRVENSLNRSVPDRVSAPAVDDGAVFVTTDDDYERDSPEGQSVGTVHRLDAATGTEEWRFETAADVETAPAVTDRAVFVAGWYRDNSSTSDYGNVALAVNRSDGTERWSYALRPQLFTSHWEVVAPANNRLYLVSNSAPYPLTFEGFLAVLNSSETEPEPYHQLADDEPVEQRHRPLVTITTDPPDAGERDLDGGENVTLTANASDADGNVTAIEWDVDGDGEYERTGETITMHLAFFGQREVTVRVTDDDGLTTTESVTLTTA